MARLKKRKDGRYCKKVYIGTKGGKPQYLPAYGITIAEAESAAAELKARIGKGMDVAQRGTSFGEMRKRFLSNKKAAGCGASWLASLDIYLRYFDCLDNIVIDKIQPGQIQQILNTLADWRDGKKPMAKATLTQIHGAVAGVFDLAIPRIMQYNPARTSEVFIPRGSGATQHEIVSDKQRMWIVETPHRAQTAAMIAMYAGLRRGEIAALTWGDIDLSDLQNATIRVNKAFDYAKIPAVVKSTKTEAGDRLVSIPRVLSNYLSAVKSAYGDQIPVYVMIGKGGKPLTESAWYRMMDSYMCVLNAKYGHGGANRFASRKKEITMKGEEKERGALPMVIKTFGLQDLRHTFCSMLYMSGMDVLVARDQMGHTDIKTTLGIYTHFDKMFKKCSMAQFDDYINNSLHGSDTVQAVL